MKPVCVPCQRFFRVKKNGFYFIEAMPKPGIPTARVEPGTAEPENWKPYKIWSGDLWQCDGCGAQIISGVGLNPISIHHEKKFADWLVSTNAAQLQVNDC